MAAQFTSIANYDVVDMFTPSTAPILSVSFHPLQPRIMLTGSMDGTAILTDLLSRQVIQAFKDHSKYVVRTAFSPDGRFLATCSYDKSINVYSTNSSFSTTEDHREDAPVEVPKIQYKKDFSKKTSTNPETIVFHPSSSHLIYSCRDDNYLRYVDLNSDTDYKVTSFNLNENQDNHVSFSVWVYSFRLAKPFHT
jgi:WD40 repeat protein